jgi:hypothetical protein
VRRRTFLEGRRVSAHYLFSRFAIRRAVYRFVDVWGRPFLHRDLRSRARRVFGRDRPRAVTSPPDLCWRVAWRASAGIAARQGARCAGALAMIFTLAHSRSSFAQLVFGSDRTCRSRLCSSAGRYLACSPDETVFAVIRRRARRALMPLGPAPIGFWRRGDRTRSSRSSTDDGLRSGCLPIGIRPVETVPAGWCVYGQRDPRGSGGWAPRPLARTPPPALYASGNFVSLATRTLARPVVTPYRSSRDARRTGALACCSTIEDPGWRVFSSTTTARGARC